MRINTPASRVLFSLFYGFLPVFFLLSFCRHHAWAQVCSTPNQDGVLSGATSIVNTYYSVLTSVTAGDLVLIIQMQGADLNTANDATYGTVTNNVSSTYEYAIAIGAVPLADGVTNLVNGYTNANFGAQGQKRFPIIRVPQYSAASAWGAKTSLPIGSYLF